MLGQQQHQQQQPSAMSLRQQAVKAHGCQLGKTFKHKAPPAAVGLVTLHRSLSSSLPLGQPHATRRNLVLLTQ